MIPSIEVRHVTKQINSIVHYAGLSDDEEVEEIVNEIEDNIHELAVLIEEKEP